MTIYSDYDTVKHLWNERTITWSKESSTKFVVQFLNDPYDCKDVDLKTLPKGTTSRNVDFGRTIGFKKIHKAIEAAHSLRDCCQFFHDNMDRYWLFEVLEELEQQHNKDKTRFKPGGLPNKEGWKGHKEQFPAKKAFSLCLYGKKPVSISATANLLWQLEAIVYEDDKFIKPHPDIFEQIACDELNAVRDREIKCLNSKQRRLDFTTRKTNEENYTIMKRWTLDEAKKELKSIDPSKYPHRPDLAEQIINGKPPPKRKTQQKTHQKQTEPGKVSQVLDTSPVAMCLRSKQQKQTEPGVSCYQVHW